MLSLDEAIKHCEEVAEENEDNCKEGIFKNVDNITTRSFKERAFEHRQLAEWLKALKEIWDSGDCNDCLHQRNCIIRPKIGQMVRYNCYQYERKIQNDNADN